MLICLNYRQDKKYLYKADEILVQYRDVQRAVMDVVNNYTQANLIIDIPEDQEINWNIVKNAKTLLNDRLILRLNGLALLDKVNAEGYKFYLNSYLSSFAALHALAKFKPVYIMVNHSLFFNLDKVLRFEIPIRFNPTITYLDSLPHENGFRGMWIRPEDTLLYEPCVLEFGDIDIKKEQALFRIYKEEGKWQGNLNMIVEDLGDENVLNRMINPQLIQRRLNCGAKCMEFNEGYACHICDNIMKMATKEFAEKIKDSVVK